MSSSSSAPKRGRFDDVLQAAVSAAVPATPARSASSSSSSSSSSTTAAAAAAPGPLPDGWIEVESQSKPGEKAYVHVSTNRRVRKRPTADTPVTKPPPKTPTPSTPSLPPPNVVAVAAVAAAAAVAPVAAPVAVAPAAAPPPVAVAAPPPPPLPAVQLGSVDVLAVRYSSQRGFTKAVAKDGLRYPVGYESQVTLPELPGSSGRLTYTNRVLGDDQFAVRRGDGQQEWTGPSADLVWEKVFDLDLRQRLHVEERVRVCLPRGFELFGFARKEVVDAIARLEAECMLHPLSLTHKAEEEAGAEEEEDAEVQAFRDELVQFVRDNVVQLEAPREQAEQRALQLLENAGMRIGKLTWKLPGSSSSSSSTVGGGGGGMVAVDFPTHGMRLYTVVDVAGLCGLLSPANAERLLPRLIALDGGGGGGGAQHHAGFAWNQVLEMEVAAADSASSSSGPLPDCSLLRSRLTVPVRRRKLAPAPASSATANGSSSPAAASTSTTLVMDSAELDCSWSRALGKFQVRYRGAVLGESASQCGEALRTALDSNQFLDLLRAPKSSSSANAAAAGPSAMDTPRSATNKSKWDVNAAKGEFIELELRQLGDGATSVNAHVKSVAFALENALVAPRRGDLVRMVKHEGNKSYVIASDTALTSSSSSSSQDDKKAAPIVSVIFSRAHALLPRELHAKPRRLFPQLSMLIAEHQQGNGGEIGVGAALFGLGASFWWQVESQRGRPVYPAGEQQPRRYVCNTPGLPLKYRDSLVRMRAAMESDVSQDSLFVDDDTDGSGSAEGTTTTSPAEHCRMMALLDVNVELDDEGAALRAELLPLVSCHKLFAAKGKPVEVAGGKTLRGYRTGVLSGLPGDALAAFNGRYVLCPLCEESANTGDTTGTVREMWVFCGGEHDCAAAFAGQMGLSVMSASSTSSSSSPVFLLTKLPPQNEEDEVLALACGSNERGWFVADSNTKSWMAAPQVKFEPCRE